MPLEPEDDPDDNPFFNYLEAWMEKSRLALDRPLCEGQVLQSDSAVEFFFEKAIGRQYADALTAPQRPVTALQELWPQSRIPASDRLKPTNVRLVLKAPIHVGPSKWAQIWLVVLSTPGAKDREVVLKIFYEALFPTPEGVDYYDGSMETAVTLSHREGWAYERLKDLQGRVIPYSYGFFNFTLPSGEDGPAHLMEYVPGSRLYEYGQSIGGPQGDKEIRWALLDRFACSLHQIHRLGVAQCDVRPPNIIVPTAHPGRFVFIDFGQAVAAVPPNPAGDGMCLFRDATRLLSCLAEIELPSALSAWCKERLQTPGLEWTEMLRCENGTDLQIVIRNTLEMCAESDVDFIERKAWP